VLGVLAFPAGLGVAAFPVGLGVPAFPAGGAVALAAAVPTTFAAEAPGAFVAGVAAVFAGTAGEDGLVDRAALSGGMGRAVFACVIGAVGVPGLRVGRCCAPPALVMSTGGAVRAGSEAPSNTSGSSKSPGGCDRGMLAETGGLGDAGTAGRAVAPAPGPGASPLKSSKAP